MIYLFEENQKFTQWWVWLILLSPIFIAAATKNIISYEGLILSLIFVVFYFLELRVKVSKQGIQYQFFPFHFKSYFIKIEEIENIEAIKYKPLGDYGGWGIRYGFKGKCYNVKGNLGVKVYLKKGSYVLFGSQKHKTLEKVLSQLLNNN